MCSQTLIILNGAEGRNSYVDYEFGKLSISIYYLITLNHILYDPGCIFANQPHIASSKALGQVQKTNGSSFRQ